MIPTELPVSNPPENDPWERVLCDLIDEYWEKLQHGHQPADSESLPGSRDPSDRSIADYRDVLSMLHRLRRSSQTNASGSRAATWVAPAPTSPRTS